MNTSINVTEAAEKLIEILKTKYAALVFHQSGGCCDGSSPMCFPKGELNIDNSDILLGIIKECEFYVRKDHLELWKDYEITLDAVEGRGSSFSAEAPYGFRFISRSQKCSVQPETTLA